MKALLTILLLLTLCGCASKSKKQAQAQAAYRQNQQSAYLKVMEAHRINIRVLGPVQNSEIQWSDGLTVARAIVAANYLAAAAPQQVVIIRQQDRIPLDVSGLLRGTDFNLEPGDTIEIIP